MIQALCHLLFVMFTPLTLYIDFACFEYAEREQRLEFVDGVRRHTQHKRRNLQMTGLDRYQGTRYDIRELLRPTSYVMILFVQCTR